MLSPGQLHGVPCKAASASRTSLWVSSSVRHCGRTQGLGRPPGTAAWHRASAGAVGRLVDLKPRGLVLEMSSETCEQACNLDFEGWALLC